MLSKYETICIWRYRAVCQCISSKNHDPFNTDSRHRERRAEEKHTSQAECGSRLGRPQFVQKGSPSLSPPVANTKDPNYYSSSSPPPTPPPPHLTAYSILHLRSQITDHRSVNSTPHPNALRHTPTAPALRRPFSSLLPTPAYYRFASYSGHPIRLVLFVLPLIHP